MLEPLILAVLHMQPDFDLVSVDVITDRRSIHLLHAFVSGKASKNFEIGADMIGDTILFARREEKSRQQLARGKFNGYRRAFEEGYTKLSGSAKGSTSHHRIVKYKFGGLRFLVRSAVDAYMEHLALTDPENPVSSKAFNKDDIAKYMKSLSLAGEAPTIEETAETPVSIVPGGARIPHAALVEFKTRFKFSKNPLNMEQEKLADLWISRTPNFLNASYQNVGAISSPWKWSRAQSGGGRARPPPARAPRLGEFVDLDLKPMGDTLKEWEAKNQLVLSQLAIVLKRIIEAVKSLRGPCVVRYESGTGGGGGDGGGEGGKLQILKCEKDSSGGSHGHHIPLVPEPLGEKLGMAGLIFKN